jgi:biopolymer transport protein TolQ
MMYCFLCEGNPFIDAYTESDLLGKVIFIALIALSIITWSVLIHKIWLIKQVQSNSHLFRKTFFEARKDPLDVPTTLTKNSEYPNAFGIIYDVLKNKTLEIFDKNRKNIDSKKDSKKNLEQEPNLSTADIGLLETHSNATISTLTKYLEKNLYVLSTIVTLAPFLGLLGTVYGILVTFTELKSTTGGGSNQIILGGLSLALCTTVLGLLDAIPALIGYNYLKNIVYEFDADMDRFSTDVLSSFELHYRNAGE